VKTLWYLYVFRKQTVRELEETYKKDRRTIRASLNTYMPPVKTHAPRAVHLIVDAVFFGQRRDDRSWCAVVARDPYAKEDLWWECADTETESAYTRCRQDLEALGYTILSVTSDGFSGIRRAFADTPFQMCHVHMERLVVKGTTRNPQLEAGQVLLALVKTLPTTDSRTFHRRLHDYVEKYRSFLNERTWSPETGTWYWTHEPLRRAVNSLFLFETWLFTFETNRDIPTTSNSLEGHFRHTQDITAIHCGLSRAQTERVLTSIFLAGTIAPDNDTLEKIL